MSSFSLCVYVDSTVPFTQSHAPSRHRYICHPKASASLTSLPHLISPHLILLHLSSIPLFRVSDAITETPSNTESFLTDCHVSHPDNDPFLPHHHDVTQKSKVMSAYHMSYWDAEDRAAVERTAAQLAALSTSLKDQAFR
jgi:hypothetical protein